VRITDAAIVAAATLSDRYISDRFLPDKAIDLIDESASSLRIQIASMPTEIDALQRRGRSLEIEREALKKEKDPASRDRLKKIEGELGEIRENVDALMAHWTQEKENISALSKLKEEIEQTRLDSEKAERSGDLGKAAELKYGKLNELEIRLK